MIPQQLKINIMKTYDTIAHALDDLKKRGYEADFATETVCLYCGDLDIRMDPEDFHVDEVYRFGDGATPGGNCVLYAITSISGVKGTLVDAYNTFSLNRRFEMAK